MKIEYIDNDIKETDEEYICTCCRQNIKKSESSDPRDIFHKMSCYVGPRWESSFDRARNKKIK